MDRWNIEANGSKAFAQDAALASAEIDSRPNEENSLCNCLCSPCWQALQDFRPIGRHLARHGGKMSATLASDKLKGRNVGSAGYDMAASFVAGKFRRAGLTPGWLRMVFINRSNSLRHP